MTILHAQTALTPSGWQNNVTVEISQGRIARVSTEAAPADAIHVGTLLPAPVNAHSHAFQRAMAGLTERRGPDPSDSFWTWRRLMYRFLDRLTPDQVQAITAYVQMEMLEAGYATNVEFHYLHHQPGGVPYDNTAEMADRITAAAEETGIGLTLLPVFYQYGGCDLRPLGPGQIRFGNDLAAFQRLHEQAAQTLSRGAADWTMGVAPHSIRAVGPDDLKALSALHPSGPIHMHLAEQVAEVDEVAAHLGQRPVEWALANLAPDARWHMVHCTQMLAHETTGLATSGATAVLCPLTESSLGDGIFDGVSWLAQNGRIAIGSDSNIRISLSEELRTLDYSQRLRDRSRAALATPEHSTGRRLLEAALEGGAGAADRATGALKTGNWADLMALDSAHPDLAGTTGDTLLDAYIFAGDDRMISHVWSAGRHMVRDGHHIHRARITAAYAAAIAPLRADL
ncbi:formimidoylglutamate deiminase [Rhodobacteraceae bacterium D3-12]|nr:formimidoylglutamate deiminase [Rhodobacteraceae bacterium D3-12]